MSPQKPPKPHLVKTGHSKPTPASPPPQRPQSTVEWLMQEYGFTREEAEKEVREH
jgi:hypothetical protein